MPRVRAETSGDGKIKAKTASWSTVTKRLLFL
jgi:hypothetical protein